MGNLGKKRQLRFHCCLRNSAWSALVLRTEVKFQGAGPERAGNELVSSLKVHEIGDRTA